MIELTERVGIEPVYKVNPGTKTVPPKLKDKDNKEKEGKNAKKAHPQEEFVLNVEDKEEEPDKEEV